SAACHMPDVVEMPYLPPLYQSDLPGYDYKIRLGSQTCLSGDVIGDYHFAAPLKEGDMLIFGDMALYTTCKTNTFNGMPLPDIALLHKDGKIETLASFGYQDFKYRLGKTK
ncbi:MAG: carboxynorspermidine decarboxylase, partial [Bacilli bacterium]|nr:carboxynorspermidine decarboxylase [Bacilli bacterium]